MSNSTALQHSCILAVGLCPTEQLRRLGDVGRKPPRLLPGYMPVARLDDAYGHDDDWVSKLSDTIAGKDLEPLDPPANRDTDIGTGQAYLATIAAIEAEKQRPSLDKTDAYVLDWMLDRMVKQRPRTLTQAAADMGMTKGGFSKRFRKLANRLRERIRTQRGITKGGFSAAEHQQLRKLVDEAAGRRAERPLFGLVPCIADRLQKRVRKK